MSVCLPPMSVCLLVVACYVSCAAAQRFASFESAAASSPSFSTHAGFDTGGGGVVIPSGWGADPSSTAILQFAHPLAAAQAYPSLYPQSNDRLDVSFAQAGGYGGLDIDRIHSDVPNLPGPNYPHASLPFSVVMHAGNPAVPQQSAGSESEAQAAARRGREWDRLIHGDANWRQPAPARSTQWSLAQMDVTVRRSPGMPVLAEMPGFISVAQPQAFLVNEPVSVPSTSATLAPTELPSEIPQQPVAGSKPIVTAPTVTAPLVPEASVPTMVSPGGTAPTRTNTAMWPNPSGSIIARGPTDSAPTVKEVSPDDRLVMDMIRLMPPGYALLGTASGLGSQLRWRAKFNRIPRGPQDTSQLFIDTQTRKDMEAIIEDNMLSLLGARQVQIAQYLLSKGDNITRAELKSALDEARLIRRKLKLYRDRQQELAMITLPEAIKQALPYAVREADESALLQPNLVARLTQLEQRARAAKREAQAVVAADTAELLATADFSVQQAQPLESDGRSAGRVTTVALESRNAFVVRRTP